MKRAIIVASLKARPVRTIVSVLAVTLEVMLILVVVGLTTGIRDETGKRMEGVGADIMFQPPNSSMFLALNNANMPMAIGGKIAEMEGVKAVTPVQTLVNSQGGSLEIMYGIDPKTFDAVSGGFLWHRGRIFSAPDEVVVDDWYARAKKVDVGDEVELLARKFKISGIVEHGKGARLFVSINTAQEMTGSINRTSLFFVRLVDSANTAAMIKRLDETFPTYPARDMRELASLMTSSSIPMLDAFIDTVVFIAVCIGVLVIFLSMYTTITERTREIGILRSMGASKSFIVGMIFQESVFVCMIGAVIGVGASFAVAWLVQFIFPTLVVLITGGWVVRAAVFAVLSGILGSVYPSMKAAAQDPVEALAYE